MKTDEAVRIDVALKPQRPEEELREIRERLLRKPREIAPRYFYDDRGSALFESICELPEYYQTRTERLILDAAAGDVVAATGADTLVELGSGSSTKTRVLLDAMEHAGALRLYVPFDVSEGIVRRTAQELVSEYEGLQVHGIIGDFMRDLGRIPEGGRRLVIFLGGTIGNFEPRRAESFLRKIAAHMEPGEHLFLGTDLIKDPTRLEAAYNDSCGTTAEFNRNALRVLNRLLGADFEAERFEHHAVYNRERHRIEMWLRSEEEQRVRLPKIDLTITVARGEEILTEISTKYDRAKVEELLDAGGFELMRWYTDPENLFALSLARRRG
jgi:L-histidine N-alpha-methyltransferase